MHKFAGCTSAAKHLYPDIDQTYSNSCPQKTLDVALGSHDTPQLLWPSAGKQESNFQKFEQM